MVTKSRKKLFVALFVAVVLVAVGFFSVTQITARAEGAGLEPLAPIVHTFGGDGGDWNTGNSSPWFYGAVPANGLLADKVDSVRFSSSEQRLAGVNYLAIQRRGWVHPGVGFFPVIGLRIETTGNLDISFFGDNYANRPNLVGDGVTINFYLNDEDGLIGGRLVRWTPMEADFNGIRVTAGDWVYVVIDYNYGISHDATMLRVTYTLRSDGLIADGVQSMIAALSTNITLAHKSAVQAARAAYDGLNAEQQALITNYQKLADAETQIAALEEGGCGSASIVAALLALMLAAGVTIFVKKN